MCTASKQRGRRHHQNAAGKRWAKKENTTDISSYFIATKKVNQHIENEGWSMEWNGNVWYWGATPCMPSSLNFQEQESYRNWDSEKKTDWEGWNSSYSVGN